MENQTIQTMQPYANIVFIFSNKSDIVWIGYYHEDFPGVLLGNSWLNPLHGRVFHALPSPKVTSFSAFAPPVSSPSSPTSAAVKVRQLIAVWCLDIFYRALKKGLLFPC